VRVGWARQFKTTVWATVRRAAASDDHKAWSDLCRAYWYPIHAFIRGLGLGQEDAEDVTQGFFATLLKPGALAVVTPDKGEFRAWLRSCARFYFLNYVKKGRTAKVGGGKVQTGLDIDNTDVLPVLRDELLAQDQLFDQCWALTVTELAMARLAEAYEREGRGELFRDLHGRLSGEESPLSDADLSALLGKKAGAIRTERSRRNDELEARYHHFLRAEIAKTVRGEGAIDAELRHLGDALGLTFSAGSRPK
jgi:RNA polymerase sigma-70 factor (ECF subfamily)